MLIFASVASAILQCDYSERTVLYIILLVACSLLSHAGHLI